MCGIFGWIKPTASLTTNLDLVEIFKNGLVETQSRGEHATGFYAPGIGIVKDAITADEFVESNVPDSLINERFVIGHCRQASVKYGKDNITNPKNAQPFESSNWVLIHNGTINTPKIKGYNYTSDVDSEVIVSYAEKTSLKNALASVDGPSTVVLYNKTEKKIYFWTNGERPLVVAYYKGIIFFASTKKILSKTLKYEKFLGIFPDVSFATIHECEPLVYDLKKNRFSRQTIIEKKVKVTTPVKSVESIGVNFKAYQPITPTPKIDGANLQRGCGPACPPKMLPDGSKGRIVSIKTDGTKIYTIK